MLTSTTYRTLSRAAQALDALRAQLYLAGARVSLLRPLVVQKQTRTTTLSFAHALLALVLALTCPTLLLVLGPLLLGVPHVASDIRYLVLRPQHAPAFGWLALAFSGALLLLRLVETAHLGNETFASVEILLVMAWMLCVVWPLNPAASTPRRLTVSVAVAGLGAVALGDPTLSRLVFAHAHNLVAVLLWYLLFRSYTRGSLAPLVFILTAAASLVCFGDSALRYIGGSEWFGVHIDNAARWLAPGFDPALGRGIVLSYAFLQSVHYGVWLLLIPQEACRSKGSPTFAMSLKSAWLDFRPLGLAAIAAGVLGVLAAATFDPVTTSAVYLFVTPFHGYLELVVLAGLWASRRPAGHFVRPALAS